MDLSFSQTTRGIVVTVQPFYLSSESMPDERHYIWAYHVTLKNEGEETVTLQSRYWNIMDGNGAVQEVRGDGVVGEQPTLKPGESFEYTSGTHLPTSSGIMRGRYTMLSEADELFEIEIPVFSLDSPEQLQRAN